MTRAEVPRLVRAARQLTVGAVSLLAIAAALPVGPAVAQVLEPHTRVLNFGTVVGEAEAERSLKVVNRSASAVRIRDVELSPPLSVVRMTPLVEPGQSAEIVVRFGGPRPAGRYEGALTVHLEGAPDPLAVDVGAILVPPIEVLPRTELVAVTERGSIAHAWVEIVSHLDRPLEL